MPCSCSATRQHSTTRRRRARVEVEHERRRSLDRLGAGERHVQLDRREVREPHERRPDRRRACSRSACARWRPSPCAPRRDGARGPASGRTTCPRRRPASASPSAGDLADGRSSTRCDRRVVVDQLTLGEAGSGDRAPCRGSTASARGRRRRLRAALAVCSWIDQRRGRPRAGALFAALVGLSPRASSARGRVLAHDLLAPACRRAAPCSAAGAGCRSAVQLANSTSTTSVGSQKWAPRGGVAPALNGESGRCNGASRSAEAVELGVAEAAADAPDVAQYAARLVARRAAARRRARRALPLPAIQPPTTSSWRLTLLIFTQLLLRRPGW